MSETKAKVVPYDEVPAQKFGPEAPGASIRWLIDDDHDGAPIFALRMIEIEAGGHSPQHAHPYEHENFVVEGHGRVLIQDSWHDLKPGDVVYMPPDTLHQYANAGSTTFKFLCGIPTKRMQAQDASRPEKADQPTVKKASC